MAINPQKVLLIYNTNSDSRIQALNTQDGVNLRDWYAQVRGLTEGNGTTDYYYLGFDFGTANYVTMGSYTVSGIPKIDGPNAITCTDCSPKMISQVGIKLPTALRNISNLYKLEAVFVMPGVPRGFNNGSFGFDNAQYIELPLSTGIGYGYVGSYLLADPLQSIVGCMGAATVDATITGTNGYSRPGAAKPLSSIRNLDPQARYPYPYFYGRIGWVLSNNQDQNYNYAWGCSSFSETQAIVNNAIAAEKVDNFSKLHVLGGTAYVAPWGGVLSGVMTNHLADSAGITNLTYIEGFMGVGYSEASWCVGRAEPVAPNGARPLWWSSADFSQVFKHTCPPCKAFSMDPNYVSGDPGDLYIKGYGGAPVQPFALISPRLGIKFSDPKCTNSLSFAPGGFAYGWMSVSSFLQEFCLRTGGSLAFGCGAEPGNGYLQESDTILYWLLNGFTGTEAIYKTGANWYYTGAVAGWDYNQTPSVPHNEAFPGTSYNNNQPYPSTISFKGSAHGDPLYAPYKARNLQPRLMQVG
jgi:hypothetical protein